MIKVFVFDNTYEGLVSAVFDAYKLKIFPEHLSAENEIIPMFSEVVHTSVFAENKYQRVWQALEKKLSKSALNQLMYVWLSEMPERANIIFHYICLVINSRYSIEHNYANNVQLALYKLAKKVSKESLYIIELVRFQLTGDGIYFAIIEPACNALPIAVSHFIDRFKDQKWIIYDTKRKYGFFYDLHTVHDVGEIHRDFLVNGKLNESLLAENEKFCQLLWKSYFNSITIKERKNLKQHKQFMPVRFWKYLPEKQI